MSETRELRKRKIVDTTNWVDIVNVGYGKFAAKKGDDNDGLQKCGADIWYLHPTKGWKHIFGETGQEAGHAEMHALVQFVGDICEFDVTKFNTILASATVKVEGKDVECGVLVECTAKPCCLFCSAMLGLLGIRPRDSDTKKSPVRMGGTQWVMLPTLRDFIAAKTGYSVVELAKIDSHKL
jgi:hypothetical protein